MKSLSHMLALIALSASSAAVANIADHTNQLIALARSGQHAECLHARAALSESERDLADNLYIGSVCALRDNKPFLARTMLSSLHAKAPNYAGALLAKAQADFIAEDPIALAKSLADLRGDVKSHPNELANDWLRRISEREKKKEIELSVRSGMGHSTNANAGSNESDFLGTPLPQVAVRVPSDFIEVSSEIKAIKSTGVFSNISGAIRLSRRTNGNAPFANQTLVSGSVRYARPQGHWLASYAIAGFDETVNQKPQRRYLTTEFIGVKRISDQWEFSGIGRVGRVDFRVRSRPDLDVWRIFWNVNATKLLEHRFGNRVGIGLFGGGDEEVIRNSNFGNTRVGIRLFADIQAGAHVQLSGEAAASLAAFDGRHGFNGISRTDHQSSVSLTASWKFKESSNWDVQFRGLVRKLDSNVTVFSLKQRELGLFVNFRM